MGGGGYETLISCDVSFYQMGGLLFGPPCHTTVSYMIGLMLHQLVLSTAVWPSAVVLDIVNSATFSRMSKDQEDTLNR